MEAWQLVGAVSMVPFLFWLGCHLHSRILAGRYEKQAEATKLRWEQMSFSQKTETARSAAFNHFGVYVEPTFEQKIVSMTYLGGYRDEHLEAIRLLAAECTRLQAQIDGLRPCQDKQGVDN